MAARKTGGVIVTNSRLSHALQKYSEYADTINHRLVQPMWMDRNTFTFPPDLPKQNQKHRFDRNISFKTAEDLLRFGSRQQDDEDEWQSCSQFQLSRRDQYRLLLELDRILDDESGEFWLENHQCFYSPLFRSVAQTERNCAASGGTTTENGDAVRWIPQQQHDAVGGVCRQSASAPSFDLMDLESLTKRSSPATSESEQEQPAASAMVRRRPLLPQLGVSYSNIDLMDFDLDFGEAEEKRTTSDNSAVGNGGTTPFKKGRSKVKRRSPTVADRLLRSAARGSVSSSPHSPAEQQQREDSRSEQVERNVAESLSPDRRVPMVFELAAQTTGIEPNGVNGEADWSPHTERRDCQRKKLTEMFGDGVASLVLASNRDVFDVTLLIDAALALVEEQDVAARARNEQVDAGQSAELSSGAGGPATRETEDLISFF